MNEITVKEMIEILQDCKQDAIIHYGENNKITQVTECIKDNRVSMWCEED